MELHKSDLAPASFLFLTGLDLLTTCSTACRVSEGAPKDKEVYSALVSEVD